MSTTTRKPPLSSEELAAELTPRIARLFRLLLRQTSELSRTSVSLLATLRDGGPRRITELAEIERVTQPAMTTLVSRLEERGYVERRHDEADRRAVQVAVTASGLEALGRMTEARTALLAGLLEGLSDRERRALAGALESFDRILESEQSR